MRSTEQRQIGPPPFSRRAIVQKAEQLTKDYARLINTDLALVTINFDHVYEHCIYPKYEIVLVDDRDLGYDENGKKILGCFDPVANTAFIDPVLKPERKDPRRAFTSWHEVGGHGILQGEWLRREMNRLRQFSAIITTEETISFDTESILERQANLFAAYAGAPTWLLKHAIKETFDLTRPFRYIGPCKYCFSVRRKTLFYDIADYNDLCRVIARQVKWRFGGLSIEALSYRVAETGYVVNGLAPSFHLRRTAPVSPPVDLAPHPETAVLV